MVRSKKTYYAVSIGDEIWGVFSSKRLANEYREAIERYGYCGDENVEISVVPEGDSRINGLIVNEWEVHIDAERAWEEHMKKSGFIWDEREKMWVGRNA